MPNRILTESLLLPEPRLQRWRRYKLRFFFRVFKQVPMEVCPKCATPRPAVIGIDEHTVSDVINSLGERNLLRSSPTSRNGSYRHDR